tara:strand:+ start:3444 stop:3698 length:255 start_codon:yes stop_codon:yes gene_type:complete
MELQVKDLLTIFALISIVGGASWRLSGLINELKTTLSTFTARMEEKMSYLEKNLEQLDKAEEKIENLTQRVIKLETWQKKSTLG